MIRSILLFLAALHGVAKQLFAGSASSKQNNKCKVSGRVQKVVFLNRSSLVKTLAASGMRFYVFPLCFGEG